MGPFSVPLTPHSSRCSIIITRDPVYMIMPRVLVIEDDLERIEIFKKRLEGVDELTFARSTVAGVYYLEHCEWDLIFLDHDLEIPPRDVYNEDWHSAMPAARYIAQHPEEFADTLVVIHSMNPIGTKAMFDLMRPKLGPRVQCSSWHTLKNTLRFTRH